MYACGDVYEGEWKGGKYHGHGSYTSAESDEYTGEWVNDTMEGKGRLMYRATGDVFEGTFVGGKPDGLGTYVSQADGEYQAEYRAGELVKKNGVPLMIPLK